MKILAKIISILFHPVFVPVYLSFIIVEFNPNKFPSLFGKHYVVVMSMIVILMVGFPLVTLLIMRGLGMVSSFKLSNVKERFIPMIAIATFYLWTFMMFKPNSNTIYDVGSLMSNMILGSIIAIFLAFFFNSFYKISLHSIGAGAMVGLIMNIMPNATYDMTIIFILSIIVAGAVATARLYLKEHTNKEVYMGLLVGYFAQFMAYQVFAKFFV